MYFADEEAANSGGSRPASSTAFRVPTLIAPREASGYTFDIHLQGEGNGLLRQLIDREMSVSPFDHPLLSALLGDAEAARHFSLELELAAMLEFDGLAEAEAAEGIIGQAALQAYRCRGAGLVLSRPGQAQGGRGARRRR